MKNNKGFTLIELLAVIVILAIIALIATPIVLNIIEKARKSAAEDSVYGSIKAIELAYTEKMLDTEAYVLPLTIQWDGSKGNLTDKKGKTGTITLGGTVPEGTMTFDGETMTAANLKVNNYSCTVTGSTVNCS